VDERIFDGCDLESEPLVEALGARVGWNDGERDREATTCGVLDDRHDCSRSEPPTLELRNDLQLIDVKRFRIRIEPQTTGRLPIDFNDRDIASGKLPGEIRLLPLIVPTPGLLDHRTHRGAVKLVEEVSVGFRRRTNMALRVWAGSGHGTASSARLVESGYRAVDLDALIGAPLAHKILSEIEFPSRETGKIYWHSGLSDLDEELPEDIDDAEKYVAIPHKNKKEKTTPSVGHGWGLRDRVVYFNEQLP